MSQLTNEQRERLEQRLEQIRVRQARCMRPDRDDVPQEPHVRAYYKELRQAEMDRGFLLSLVDSKAAEGAQTPFCSVHADIEKRDGLVLEVGNDCVACSLHERTALLNLLEPFAPADGSQDSLTVLKGLIDSAAWPSRVAASPAAPDKKLARQIIDAVIASPCVVEVRMFSQPEAVDALEDQILAMLRRQAAASLAASVVDADAINNAADKIADYFNAPPSVIPAIEKIIQRCAAASTASTQDAEQTWCDHCSADLNSVKHILCERCYREFAASINTRESLRAAILDWLAHRCDRAPVCGICTYCRVAGFVRAVDPPTSPTPSSQPAIDAAREIHGLCDRLAPDIPGDSTSYAPTVEQIAAIISRYFPEP